MHRPLVEKGPRSAKLCDLFSNRPFRTASFKCFPLQHRWFILIVHGPYFEASEYAFFFAHFFAHAV